LVLEKQGKFDEALELYEKALKTTIEALGLNHAAVADTYVNMANVEQQLGNFAKALELYQKALEIQLKCLGGAHADVAVTYMNMGNVEDELGNSDTKNNIAIVYGNLGNQAGITQGGFEADVIELVRPQAGSGVEEQKAKRVIGLGIPINPSANSLEETRLHGPRKQDGKLLV
jgi:tetratricopeptide (TPR) repeat protein